MAETSEQKIERLKKQLEEAEKLAELTETERDLKEKIASVKHPDRGNIGNFSIVMFIFMALLTAGLAIEHSRLAVLPFVLTIGLGAWIYDQYHNGKLNRQK